MADTPGGEGPPEIDGILSAVRNFVRDELLPLEADLLSRPFGGLVPRLREKREAVRRLGLWNPQLSREHGGLGLTLSQFAHVSEELGRSPLGHYSFNCQAPDVSNMELLLRHGSPRQREAFLAPLLSGEIRSCFAMTEPEHAGSNPVWLGTSARTDGADYVLSGHKWFVSSADGAAFAIVMAVTNPEAGPYRRASLLLVPTETPGFRRVRNIPLMGHAGEDYLSHAEVVLEECRVPRANLIGEQGSGFALAQERLGPGRIHHCMRWVGICERAFEMMCARAATRELSPGVMLASRQAVQHWIADSRAEIRASRLLVLQAAGRIDESGASAAREEISLIKFFVSGVLQRVLDRAIQVHGALGLTEDTILSFFARQERAARIYDGPDEVHKSVVAREVLKHYGIEVEI